MTFYDTIRKTTWKFTTRLSVREVTAITYQLFPKGISDFNSQVRSSA